MEIYRLISRGDQLAHSYRAPKTAPWGVIFFLKSRGVATKEQILDNVPAATSITLQKLKYKRIIAEEAGVNV